MELYVQKLIWGIQALTVTLCLGWENWGHQIISRRPEGTKSIGAKRYIRKKVWGYKQIRSKGQNYSGSVFLLSNTGLLL